MDASIINIVTVTGLSAVKYAVGFFAALGLGFSFWEIMIFNVGGGMLGVLLYLYLWKMIVTTYRKFFPAKEKKGIKIRRMSRMIVKIVKKYELYGVAFLTPILLSVPLGVVIATALEKDKWRIKRFMLVSFLCWTLFFYGLYSLFGIRLDEVV